MADHRRYKDMACRRGALRHVASRGAEGRSLGGWDGGRGLITSQGGLAIRGLPREAMTAGQELGEAYKKLRG